MLTDKQRAFVEHYAVHRNATAAARHAGYSAASCSTQGSRLLQNVDVQAEIGRIQDAARVDAVMSLEEAAARLTRIARGPSDDLAIRAISKLGDLLGWNSPTRIAMTTPTGEAVSSMAPHDVVQTYAEALSRAISDAPPIKVEAHTRQGPPLPRPPAEKQPLFKVGVG